MKKSSFILLLSTLLFVSCGSRDLVLVDNIFMNINSVSVSGYETLVVDINSNEIGRDFSAYNSIIVTPLVWKKFNSEISPFIENVWIYDPQDISEEGLKKITWEYSDIWKLANEKLGDYFEEKNLGIISDKNLNIDESVLENLYYLDISKIYSKDYIERSIRENTQVEVWVIISSYFPYAIYSMIDKEDFVLLEEAGELLKYEENIIGSIEKDFQLALKSFKQKEYLLDLKIKNR